MEVNYKICFYFVTTTDTQRARLCIEKVDINQYFDNGFYIGVFSSMNSVGFHLDYILRSYVVPSRFYIELSISEVKVGTPVYIKLYAIVDYLEDKSQSYPVFKYYELQKIIYTFNCPNSLINEINRENYYIEYKIYNCKIPGVSDVLFYAFGTSNVAKVTYLPGEYSKLHFSLVLKKSNETCVKFTYIEDKKFIKCFNNKEIETKHLQEGITFELKTRDLYYNNVLVRDNDILNDFRIVSPNNNNNTYKIISKKTGYIEILFNSNDSGIFYIYSSKLQDTKDYSIYFNVIDKNISLTNSLCNILNHANDSYDLYTYDIKDHIDFECEILSTTNNGISKEIIQNEFNNNSFQVQIVDLDNNILEQNINYNLEVDIVDGYLKGKIININLKYETYSTNFFYKSNSINSNNNKFTLKYAPKIIEDFNFYTFLDTNTYISYKEIYSNYISNNSNFAYAIDENSNNIPIVYFMLVDNNNEILLSNLMTKFQENISLYIDATFINRNIETGEYKISIDVNICPLNGKKHICLTLNDTNYIRRSSFIYDLHIKLKNYENNSVYIPFKTNIDIGDKIATHHPFDANKTRIKEYNNLKIFVGDKDSIILEVEYRTIVDSFFNYNNKDGLIYNDYSNHLVECKYNKIEDPLVKNKFEDIFTVVSTSIEGIINIKLTTEKKNICKLSLIYKDNNVLSGKSYNIIISHKNIVYDILFIDYKFLDNNNVIDGDLISADSNNNFILVKLLDKYGNFFDIHPPSNYSDLFKININLKIDKNSSNLEGSEFFYDKLNISKHSKNDDIYLIHDNLNIAGKYTITINYNLEKALTKQLKYFKRPGLANGRNSYVILASPPIIESVQESIIVLIELYDNHKNLIFDYSDILKEEAEKIEIKLYSLLDNSILDLRFLEIKDERDFPYLKFKSDVLKNFGQFVIKSYINQIDNKQEIACKGHCSIIHTEKQFEFSRTKVNLVLNDLIELKKEYRYVIDKNKINPVFVLIFYDINNKEYNDVKISNIHLKSYLQSNISMENIYEFSFIENLKYIDLTYSKDNILEFKDIEEGYYDLVLTYNTKESLRFPLYITEGNNQKNTNKTQNINYLNTTFNKVKFSNFSNEKNLLIVELRDDNYKYIENLDINLNSEDFKLIIKDFNNKAKYDENLLHILKYVIYKQYNTYQILIDFIIEKSGFYVLNLLDINNNIYGCDVLVEIKESGLYELKHIISDENDVLVENKDITKYNTKYIGSTINLLFKSYDISGNVNSYLHSNLYTEESILNLFNISNNDTQIINNHNVYLKILRDSANNTISLNIISYLKGDLVITSVFLEKKIVIPFLHKTIDYTNIKVSLKNLYLEYNVFNSLILSLVDSYNNKINANIIQSKDISFYINNKSVEFIKKLNSNNELLLEFKVFEGFTNKLNVLNIYYKENLIECSLCKLRFIPGELNLNKSLLFNLYANIKLNNFQNKNKVALVNQQDITFINLYAFYLKDDNNNDIIINSNEEFENLNIKAYFEYAQKNNDNNEIIFINSKSSDIIAKLCIDNLNSYLLLNFCNDSNLEEYFKLISNLSQIILTISLNENKVNYIINLNNSKELLYQFDLSSSNEISLLNSFSSISYSIATAGEPSLFYIQLRDINDKKIKAFDINNIDLLVYDSSNNLVSDTICIKKLFKIKKDGFLLGVISCKLVDNYEIYLKLNNNNKKILDLLVEPNIAYKIITSLSNLKTEDQKNDLISNKYSLLKVFDLKLLDKYGNKANLNNISYNILNANNNVESSYLLSMPDNTISVYVKYYGYYKIISPFIKNNEEYNNTILLDNIYNINYNLSSYKVYIDDNKKFIIKIYIKDESCNKINFNSNSISTLDFELYYRGYYKNYSINNLNNIESIPFVSQYFKVKDVSNNILLDNNNDIYIEFNLSSINEYYAFEFDLLAKIKSNNQNEIFNKFGYSSSFVKNSVNVDIVITNFNPTSNMLSYSSNIVIKSLNDLVINIFNSNYKFNHKSLIDNNNLISIDVIEHGNEMTNYKQFFTKSCCESFCFYYFNKIFSEEISGEFLVSIYYNNNVLKNIDLNVNKFNDDILAINNALSNITYQKTKNNVGEISYIIIEFKNSNDNIINDNFEIMNNIYLLDDTNLAKYKLHLSFITRSSIQGIYLIRFSSYGSNAYPIINKRSIKIMHRLSTQDILIKEIDIVFYPNEFDYLITIQDGKSIKPIEDTENIILNDVTTDNNKIVVLQAYDIHNNETILNLEKLNINIKSKNNPNLEIKYQYYNIPSYNFNIFKIYNNISDTYEFKSINSFIRTKIQQNIDNNQEYTKYSILFNAINGNVNINNSLLKSEKILNDKESSIIIKLNLYDKNFNKVTKLDDEFKDEVLKDINLIYNNSNYYIHAIQESKILENKNLLNVGYKSKLFDEPGIYYYSLAFKEYAYICNNCLISIENKLDTVNSIEYFCIDHFNTENKCELYLDNKMYYHDPLKIRIYYKDKYGNTIKNRMSNDIYGILSGRNMIEIKYVVSSLASDDYIELSMLNFTNNNNYYEYENYQRLVSGPGYYLSIFDNNNNNLPFAKLNIYIIHEYDDREYGNGLLSIENTEIDFIENNQDNLQNNLTIKISNQKYKTVREIYKYSYLYINLYNSEKKLLNFKLSSLTSNIKLKFVSSNKELNIESISQLTYGKLSITYNYAEVIKESVDISLYIFDKKTPIVISLENKPLYPVRYAKLTYISNKNKLKIGEELTIRYNLYDAYNNLYYNDKNFEHIIRISIDKNVLYGNSPKLLLINDDYNYEYEIKYNVLFHSGIQLLNLIDINNNNYLLENNFKLSVESIIDITKTIVSGPNLNGSIVGEKLDIYLKLKDTANKCIEIDDDFGFNSFKAHLIGPLDSDKTKKYSFNDTIKITNENNTNSFNECNFLMKLRFIDDVNPIKISGIYKLGIIINGYTLIDEKEFIHIVNPNKIDPKSIKIEINSHNEYNIYKIPAGSTLVFRAYAYDAYNNIPKEDFIEKFEINLLDYNTNELEYNKNIESDKNINLDSYLVSEGIIEYKILITKAKTYKIQYKLDENEIFILDEYAPKLLNVVPGKCENIYTDLSNEEFFISPKIFTSEIGKTFKYNFTCKDKYNNSCTSGGERFKSNVFQKNEKGYITNITLNALVKDNNNGTYTFSTTTHKLGFYVFSITLNNNTYGNIKTIKVIKNYCPKNKPIKCPNKNKCESSIINCRDKPSIKNCKNMEKPFYCKDTNEIEGCQKSVTDCMCPKGYTSCKNRFPNKYCVPKKLEDVICPFYLPIRCSNYGSYFKQFNDGICRKRSSNPPNRRVCPVGLVLCPDLSCKNKFSDCKYTNICKKNELVCLDMSCVDDYAKCPSSITCKYTNQVVCPDGECVDNEIYCKELTKCNELYPYLCNNNVCAKNKHYCLFMPSCGHGKSLCSDYTCKEICN